MEEEFIEIKILVLMLEEVWMSGWICFGELRKFDD